MRVFLIFALLTIFLYNMNNQTLSRKFFYQYLGLCVIIIGVGVGSFVYIDNKEPLIASNKETISALETSLKSKDLPQADRDKALIQITEKKKEIDNFNRNKEIINLGWR